LARSIEDLAFGFSAIEGSLHGFTPAIAPLPALAGLRLGRVDSFFLDGADPSIVDTFDRAVQALARAGAVVRDAALPGCEEATALFRQGGLAAPELCAFLKA